MLRRYLATVVAAAAVVTVFVAQNNATATSTVECRGGFPVFERTALTEEENAARIACVQDRKATHRQAISELRSKNESLTERIKELKQRRERNRARVRHHRSALAPLGEVVYLLRSVSGYVSWINTTSACESGNNGKGQFSLQTWSSLYTADRYNVGDPHTAAVLIQDAGMVENLERSGDEQWPHCGEDDY
jgi:hypothetical protein